MDSNYLSIVTILALVYGVFQLARIHSRLQGTEAKLALLITHLGVDLNAISEPSEKVKELARQPGSKIPAIKAYREQTGADLKEAQAVVDRLAREQSDV